eukprot:scaffold4296_cov136-Isochrysis_galbana.AAC.3
MALARGLFRLARCDGGRLPCRRCWRRGGARIRGVVSGWPRGWRPVEAPATPLAPFLSQLLPCQMPRPCFVSLCRRRARKGAGLEGPGEGSDWLRGQASRRLGQKPIGT